jgi:hypothetical protein
MQASSRIFWAPKRGNTTDEDEDAFWPREPLALHSKLLRFAVADGATETSFAGSWARILTRAYCRDLLSEKKIRKTMPRLEQEWRSAIGNHTLPWYAEEKLNQGAFATLLGLTVSDGEWQATAIGDSCLFQVRGGGLVTAFPMTRAMDFSNHPCLLSSNSRRWTDELTHVDRAGGAWKPGDDFYLMTDAIACWFLGAIEREEPPEDAFRHLEQFDEWIESLRGGGMRNDDVTVLRISVR